MKKIVITILYWVFAVSAIAFVLWRAGLPLWEPVLMALLFIPGCMALKFILPKISFRNFREGILNVFYILCAVVLTVMLMLMISQLQLNMDGIFQSEYINPILVNPLFIAAVMLVLAFGDRLVSRFFRKDSGSEPDMITFNSEYRKIALASTEIRYIESRDTEVWIYATEDRTFRNRTGITQWENLLGEDFVRVHRSYLVRRDRIVTIGSEYVILSDNTEIPVSKTFRKNLLSDSSH
ncbi:MAG: LytTR family transcriptional regulator [Bacteroidales bacterium]|nr:LytTR family transcriptional regulator [Bacteroidales bacterium]